MLRRIGRKIIVRTSFVFAYSVYGIISLLQTPLWIIILVILTTSTIASIAKLELFTWDKTALQLLQTPQAYMQTMHTSHLFGDPLLAEHIYLDATSQPTTSETKHQLRNAAYPQEKLEQLRSFWTAMLAKQPSSREAFAALTAIHQSLHESEALSSTLETWMFIEPNDPRLAGVKFISQ